MFPSNDRVESSVAVLGVPDERPDQSVQDDAIALPNEPSLGEIAKARLSEHLNAADDDADPVTGLETAVRSMADGLSHKLPTSVDREWAPHADIGAAVDTLARVALESDDAVTALEQGADALAEALAAQEIAAQQQLHATAERQIDELAAYRHARLHRVTELIDLGYSLDQAVAVTNANETEIRSRALAAGRDPMEPIYKYALLTGYRGARPGLAAPSARGGQAARSVTSRRDGEPSMLEALASMSDDVFAETTRGDRWRELFGG